MGTVQTSHGDLPDRPILLTLQFRGNTIATGFSDSEGKFSFSQLLPNAYHVLVNDEKFRPVDLVVEINPMVTTPSFVRVNLVPREAASKEVPTPGSNPNMVNSAEYTKQIPKSALKEYDKGVKADKEGRTDEAIVHYEKAVGLAPKFYAARNNLGSDYMSRSQLGRARQEFEAVIKTNPSDAAAYFNLGNLSLLASKYEDAIQWLQQGLAKEPGSPLGHFLLGSVYIRTGRAELAEDELHNSLQLDPTITKAHLALVNLYLQERRNSKAIEELKEFLKVSPHDPLAPKARDLLGKLEAR